MSVEITDPLCWLSWAGCLVAAFPLFFSRRPKGNIGLFSPLVWLGLAYVAFHVFPAFNILVFGPVWATWDPHSFVSMSLASATGVLAFRFGWQVKMKSAHGTIARVGKDPLAPSVASVSILLAASLTSFGLMVSGLGGLSGFLSVEGRTVGRVDDAYRVMFVAFILSCVPLPAEAYLLARRVARPLRFVLWAVAFLTLAYSVTVLGRIGTRLFLLHCFAALGAAAVCFHRKKLTATRPLVVGLALLVLFPVVGRVRQEFSYSAPIRSWEAAQAASRGGWYATAFMTGDLDAFENGMSLFTIVPHSAPLLWGSSLVAVLYNPVPRVWWAGKPAVSISQILVDATEGVGRIRPDGNFALSLIAELYGNFWWPGILIGMFVFGAASAVIYRAHLRQGGRAQGWTFLACYCAYVFLVMRGSFLVMTAYYLQILAWLVAARSIPAFTARRRRASPQLSRGAFPAGLADQVRCTTEAQGGRFPERVG